MRSMSFVELICRLMYGDEHIDQMLRKWKKEVS